MTPLPLGQNLANLAGRFGSQTAVQAAGETCSFQDLAGHAAAVAHHLAGCGVKPGEPVATFLRNGIPAVWTSYGVTLAGAAEASINFGLADAEIAYLLKLIGARVAIVEASAAERFRRFGVAVHVAEQIGTASRPADPASTVPGDAHGKIVFTSGTTGNPKAIVYSHAARWLGNVLLRAHLPLTPGPGTTILLMTPFTHGASILAHAFLDFGASAYLMDGVDVPTVRRLLNDGAVDCLFAPPTVLAKLVGALEGRRYDGVRAIFSGTATLTPALYRQARHVFGPVIRVTYGKSEMVNPITVLGPAESEAFYTDAIEGPPSLGWPATGVQVEIRDEDGHVLPTGEAGEIHLRSPHMMSGHFDESGYHKMPDDAWHASGDMGLLAPNGALHLVGRRNDVIKSGGYKVFPQEIESVLAELPQVGAVSVVGVPSEYWGEIIVAVAEDASADWPERAAAQAEVLTKYKRPRHYLPVQKLARGAQDKIQRRRVLEQVLSLYRLEDGPHPRLVPMEPQP